jgi:tRNA threonylcarbamoyladenosine biosynthesis protein TsaE
MKLKPIHPSLEFQVFKPSELKEVSSRLIAAYPELRIFAFFGEMGVGKTTFIKAICKVLGCTDVVSSPTFSIINEYATRKGGCVYHFDFYRIKKPEEIYDLGYEDYFFSGNYCLIEWPEKLGNLLPEDTCRVLMEDQQGMRSIRVLHPLLA